MQGVMIVRKRHDAESRESERQRTFPPLHASSLPFPAFHLRCRVPKISKLAASFLPGAPLKFSHCDEWSLRSGRECRCCLSVPVEVAVASLFLGRADMNKNSLQSSSVGVLVCLSRFSSCECICISALQCSLHICQLWSRCRLMKDR